MGLMPLNISDEVARRSGLNAANFSRHELTVRNRREPLTVIAVEDVRLLARVGETSGAGTEQRRSEIESAKSG